MRPLRRLALTLLLLALLLVRLEAVMTTIPLTLFPSLMTASAHTTLTLSTANAAIAFLVTAPRSGTISGGHFYLGTVTTGQTLRVTAQDIASTGLPDATEDQTATVSVANGDDNLPKTFAFGTGRTVTIGDQIWIVIGWDGTTGNLAISTGAGGPEWNNRTVAHRNDGTTTWTKQIRDIAVVLEYSDAPTIPEQYFFGTNIATTNDSFANNSNPNERGCSFTVPVQVRAVGACYFGRNVAAGNVRLRLYDNGTPTLLAQTASLDGDSESSPTTDARRCAFFDSAQTLSTGTTYNLFVFPENNNTINLNRTVISSTTITTTQQAAMAGGTAWNGATRNGGAISSSTSRYWVTLLIDQIDIPTGGGATRPPFIIGEPSTFFVQQ